MRPVCLHERPCRRAGELGCRCQPHPHRDFRLKSAEDTGHRGGSSPATAPAGRVCRRGPIGVLCAERPKRPLGSGLPEPPRTCRGMRCARAVGMPDRGLPHLRDCTHQRRCRLPARARGAAGRRQCADLLLPSSVRHRHRPLIGSFAQIRSVTEARPPGQGLPVASSPLFAARLANASRAAGPPLLFGLRLWAAVCLALYVAFWLELDNAYWAGTSAALVCQPHLGASLRKGWFRMIGTLVGAVFIVVLTGLFPQNRFGFLIGLALWGGACALMATLLRNFAAYAAALAGFTAAIIASDQLGATGGPNGQAFILAVFRVSEIWIGIVSAGIVLAGTDFGDAPRRLATQFATLAAEIAKGFSSSLALAGVFSSDTLQPVRRELIRRVIALDPIMDESLGESSRLCVHSPPLP